MRYVLVYFLFLCSIQAGFVELKNGRLIEGPAIDKNSSVLIGGKTYPLNEISSYELDKPLGDDDGEYIILKDGSIIKATVTKFSSSSGEFEVEHDGSERKISIKDVRALSFAGSRYPLDQVKDNNRLFSKSGEPVEGTVTYFTRTLAGVGAGSTKRYKKSTLSSFVLDSGEIPKTPLSIFTTSREIYCGKLSEIKNDRIIVENVLGKTEIPVNRIVRFNLSPGQIEDFHEKQIKNVQQTPYFDSVRKLSFNRSFTGEEIRLRGLAVSHFVELHTRTEVKIALPAGAVSFNAEGFIDPAARSGDLELQVLLKGKEVYKTRVRSGTESSKIKVNVKGHTEMTLIADFGMNGSSGDYLILARPHFLLEKP